MSFLIIFQLLYALSWVVLVAPLGLMFVVYLPPDETIAVIAGACAYIAGYMVLRGLGRLLTAPSLPVPSPEDAVRIRRIILEEITPLSTGTPTYRVRHDERGGYAR